MIDIAVIVEPRLHPQLKNVIDNMIEFLNINTKIMVFHSEINMEFLLSNYKDNNRIILKKLTKLRNNNLTIPEYNILLTSMTFWNQIEGEYILIFQTDSCLCQHVDDFNLEPYKEYGFVGAPCRDINDKYNTWRNGGFSLRRKSLTLKCLKLLQPYEKVTINEDKFYTVICKDIIKPAPYDLSMIFSIEKYYYDKPLGLHKTWKYIKKEQWDELFNNFPHLYIWMNFI
jgi:hypothetical protein